MSTLFTILFALTVVIFLSSLPWLIGAIMDRRKKPPQHPSATTIRDEDLRP